MDGDVVALHEAAHAVAARALGIGIVRCAVDDPPGVTSRWLRGTTRAEKAATLLRVVVIDLAPGFVDADRAAIATDFKNAERHCLEAVKEKHNLADDEVTDEHHAVAARLLRSLRQKTAALVRAHLPAIKAVAAALSVAGELSEQDVDELRAGAEPRLD